MKHFLLTAFTFLSTALASAQGWQNPLVLGGQEAMGHGDPYILKYRGTYYLYSSSHEQPRCWTSRDLVNWTDAQIICHDSKIYGAYAPEVVYWNGKFYMCTSPYGNGHYILTSDSPLGPFSVVTGNLGYVIDGSFFIDDDGQFYFFHAEGNGIRGNRMPTHTSFGPYADPGCTMLGQWTEGPGVFKRNGIYYMFYTGNHVVTNGYRIDYATSTAGALGRYTPASEQNPILIDAENPEHYGLGHGSAFVGPDLDSYYFCYHNLVRRTGFMGAGGDCYRLYNFDRIAWNGDKMHIYGPTDWPQEAPRVAPNDYFDRDELGADWQLSSGEWEIVEKDFLRQSAATGRHTALFSPYSHDNYTAEFTVRAPEGQASGFFGAVYSYADADNYSEALVSIQDKTFTVRDFVGGSEGTVQTFALPADFEPTAWHSIRVEKNDRVVAVFIDDMRKVRRRIRTEGGQVGYVSADCQADFSYIAVSEHVDGSGIKGIHIPVPTLFAAQHFSNSSDGISLATQSLANGSAKIVKMNAGAWADYLLNIREDGPYNVGLRYRSNSDARVNLYLDNELVAGNYPLPATKNAWTVATINALPLLGGYHTLRLEVKDAAVTFYELNVRKGVNEPVELADDFEEGISELWGYRNGDWSYEDGQARIQSYGKMLMGTYETAALTDFVAEVDVTYLSSPNAGLIFRTTNPSTGGGNDNPVLGTDFLQGYFFAIGTNSVLLGKQNYGWQTLYNQGGMTFDTTTPRRLKVECRGANIKCYVDDVLYIDYTDPAPFIQGRAGMRSHNCTALFDNFRIAPLETETEVSAPFIAPTAPTGVYNLLGQRLSSPQPGLNIIGGRKVLVKPI